MSERYVDVPGGRLAVHDFGFGPAVVLLHAGIVDSWAWEPLTPFLLEAGYRVVAFDRRGVGGSTTDDVAFSNRADTIAVLDALELHQAALVGNSIGGMVALSAACRLRQQPIAGCRLEQVVLIDCAQRRLDDKRLAELDAGTSDSPHEEGGVAAAPPSSASAPLSESL